MQSLKITFNDAENSTNCGVDLVIHKLVVSQITRYRVHCFDPFFTCIVGEFNVFDLLKGGPVFLQLLSRVSLESTVSKHWIASMDAVSHPISGSSTKSCTVASFLQLFFLAYPMVFTVN